MKKTLTISACLPLLIGSSFGINKLIHTDPLLCPLFFVVYLFALYKVGSVIVNEPVKS